MKEIEVSKVIFDKRFYPRLKVSPGKVSEYEDVLSLLPPIIINQDKVLIDGAHRLQAFKNKEQKRISYEEVKTEDDDDLLLKAIELNSKHGFQLTQKEKKDEIVKLYEKVVKGEAKSFNVARLKQAFSIPDSTFSDWTKGLNEQLEGQLLEKVLKLHLQCKTQEEIGKEIGTTGQTAGSKVREIELKFNELNENPNSEIGSKFGFFEEKLTCLKEFSPRLFNLWYVAKLSNDANYFGTWPIEFMENLLYYYTKPFDVVYDPFAGGGVAIDACEKWFRKCYASDRKPTELRKDEIKKWDIKDGLPKDLPSPKLTFLDPPYWKQAEGKYSNDKDDLANVSLEKFYSSLEAFVKELKKKMKSGSFVALVIQGTQWKNNLKLEDHAFKLYKILEKHFEFEQRIICPYSTQQYNAQMIEKTKKEKIMLTLYRDLLVFKKTEGNK